MRHVLILAVLLATSAASRAQVVINEALPAPSADWNGNAIPSPVEDEWVELANAGETPVDLENLFLAEEGLVSTPRAGFEGQLAAGEHLFVTGEHALDWQHEHGGPGDGLALSNDSGALALYRDQNGVVECLDRVAWDVAPPDVSFGRWPDADGAPTPFDALAGGSGLQPTPGGANGGIAAPKILSWACEPPAPTSFDPLRVRVLAADLDGIAQAELRWRREGGTWQILPMTFAEGSTARGTWEGTIPPQPAGTTVGWLVRVSDGALLAETNEELVPIAGSVVGVVLNEILADPPPDPDGDANGDGVRNSSDDEFVEILNHGLVPVDLSGWTLSDSTGVRHEFAAGVVLDPGELYVVFGGGTPTGIPSTAVVASSGALSLNNTADHVVLRDVSQASQDAHSYGAEANADQSLIRLPDGNGPWTRPHDSGLTWNYSPGALNSQPSAIEVTSWARVKGLYRD